MSVLDTKQVVEDYTDKSKILVKIKCRDGVKIYVDRRMLITKSRLFADMFAEYDGNKISIDFFESDVICVVLEIIQEYEIYDYITPTFGIKLLRCLALLDLVPIVKQERIIENILDFVLGYEFYVVYSEFVDKYKISTYTIQNGISLLEKTDKIIKFYLEIDKIKNKDKYYIESIREIVEPLHKWKYEGVRNEKYDNNPNINKYK